MALLIFKRCEECENLMPLWMALPQILTNDGEQEVIVAKAACCAEPDLCRSLEKNAKCNNVDGRFHILDTVYRLKYNVYLFLSGVPFTGNY